MKKQLKYIFSIVAGAAMTMLSACTADDVDMPATELTPDDLVEGIAYTVDVDPATNKVTMKSLLGSRYVTNWIHPQGIENGTEVETSIPFAGDYEIKFGVMTRAGMVYGEPYKFTIANTNVELLSDPLWGYLATGPGESKTWVLDHNTYDLGSVTFCNWYMGWDKFTDGKEYTADDYPDVDDVNWSWQAGEPDWMFSSDVFNSIPELTFDLDNGAHVTINGQTYSYNMNPDTKALTMPNINWLGDGVSSSYLTDYVNVEIVKLNEHVLALKVIRNDGVGSTGDQRLVFCYVEKGWDGSWPTGGPSLTVASPKLPEFSNLAEDLFTIETDDASYYASAITYLPLDENQIGELWWNGAYVDSSTGTQGRWEWVASSYAELADAEDYSLVLESKGSYTYTTPNGTTSGSLTIGTDPATLGFDKNVELVPGSSAATEWNILQLSPADGILTLGIPAGNDENGAVNRYRCIRYGVKAIGGGESGPTVIAFDNDVLSVYIDSSNYNSYRIELYNPWGGDGPWAIDPSKIKIKDGKTLKIAFTLPGVTWKDGSDPKAILCHNFGDGVWPGSDGGCFSTSAAVSLNKSGETVVSYTNNTGAAVTAEGNGCVTICIDQRGMADSPLNADGDIDADVVKAVITSITIE